jgi:hypothetical protein
MLVRTLKALAYVLFIIISSFILQAVTYLVEVLSGYNYRDTTIYWTKVGIVRRIALLVLYRITPRVATQNQTNLTYNGNERYNETLREKNMCYLFNIPMAKQEERLLTDIMDCTCK